MLSTQFLAQGGAHDGAASVEGGLNVLQEGGASAGGLGGTVVAHLGKGGGREGVITRMLISNRDMVGSKSNMRKRIGNGNAASCW